MVKLWPTYKQNCVECSGIFGTVVAHKLIFFNYVTSEGNSWELKKKGWIHVHVHVPLWKSIEIPDCKETNYRETRVGKY